MQVEKHYRIPSSTVVRKEKPGEREEQKLLGTKEGEFII